MLAGLLFAVQGAEDRPGTLVATLPFGGVTLIEYQARLLVEAGASQIVVVVARLTPELAGATARLAKLGVSIDIVRGAAEAAQKLHPLARVLVLADGLVATADTIAPLARDGADTLLTVEAAAAPASFERVGGDAAWAGAAGIASPRVAEVAGMPSDYDMQSTLVRVVAQSGARHQPMGFETVRGGHGIERRGAALEERGRAILAATLSGRRGWFDRWIVAPLARRALPMLMTRAISTEMVAGGSAVAALTGLALAWFGWSGTGLVLVLAGATAAVSTATLAWMRDESGLRRVLVLGASGAAALAALLLGRAADLATDGTTGLAVAVAAVVLGGLSERAALEHRRRRWWGSPLAYLTLLVPFALFGWPTTGLAAAAAYAAVTLGAAIEDLRRHA